MDDKEITNVKKYDPNTDVAGYAHVPIGQKVEQVTNGGEGSGNFGHEGRPGEVGGSGEGGGSGKESIKVDKSGTTRTKEGVSVHTPSKTEIERRKSEGTKMDARIKERYKELHPDAGSKEAYIRGHIETYGDSPEVRKMASDRYDFKQLPPKEREKQAGAAMSDYLKEFGMKYDPETDRPGTAFVPNCQKTEMITNPPYQTPELGDAPEEMQKEADSIYKALRKEQFHEETPADRESAARVMWSTLEKNWKKGKDGKWVKKSEE